MGKFLPFVLLCFVVGCSKGERENETLPDSAFEHAPDSCINCQENAKSSTGQNTSVSNQETEKTPEKTTLGNGVKDGDETDVDCGGTTGVACNPGKNCSKNSDCSTVCGESGKCAFARSCRPYLGGSTCGSGEVGEPGAQHEDCCVSLPVSGYVDPANPGKKVYLDKYEITAGRIREWIRSLSEEKGKPNIKEWIKENRPALWSTEWNDFLPEDEENGSILVNRRLLGDPRPEDNGVVGPPGPGVILPPPTDEYRKLGTNYQFNSEVYVDVHGSNCAAWPGSYGFPTYWYPKEILKRDGQLERADGVGYDGKKIPAKELLDVKSMNCITNVMLAAFCAWDGGQLATSSVLDYVTETPASLGNVSGCGIQHDDHGELLGNVFTNTLQSGGRCADVYKVNATFDAGDVLPVLGSPLNAHIYSYPFLGNVTHDKSWQISAPGRVVQDYVKIQSNSSPWMDIHGNLNEASLDFSSGKFNSLFSLKYRGIGYGSSRSDLNMTLMKGENMLRIQRPEAKSALVGGRCMRFR